MATNLCAIYGEYAGYPYKEGGDTAGGYCGEWSQLSLKKGGDEAGFESAVGGVRWFLLLIRFSKGEFNSG
jgi:hypothetical protein